jgi:hypothetical protein
MEELLEAVFSARSVSKLYVYITRSSCDPLVEAGSNTSTVTLRVIGGDEKGSLKSETVKYGHEFKRLGPENDCAGEGQHQL